ncbi:MAG: MFS transporter [Actinocatenispora sp.]
MDLRQSPGDRQVAPTGPARTEPTPTRHGPVDGARTLAVIGAATLLVLIVFTTVTTTVGQTAREFGTSVGWQTWALSGMSLGLAAALLTSGSLADRFGRRRVLSLSMIGLAVFTALGAAAPSMGVFVAARVLQGVAGAGVLSAGLGLIGHTFPSGPARTHATGVWSAMLGAGIATGPILGALLTDWAGWRSSYAAIAIGAAALTLAWRALPETRQPATARRVDLPGALTMLVAMSSLTAALTAGRSGWTSPTTLTLFTVGLVALAAFTRIETVRREPMLDLGLLRTPAFLASVGGAVTTGLTMIGLMSYSPTLYERGFGYSALAAGGILSLWSFTSTAVAMQARRLPARWQTRGRLVTGLVACAVGAAALGGLTPGSPWWRLVPGLIVAGVGSGLVNSALARLAVESVPHGSASLGSGANNTARYLGSALGIALVVAIVSTAGTGHAGLIHGWNHAALTTAVLSLAGAGLVLAYRPRT